MASWATASETLAGLRCSDRATRFQLCVVAEDLLSLAHPSPERWRRCLLNTTEAADCLCGTACITDSCLFQASQGAAGADFVASSFSPWTVLAEDRVQEGFSSQVWEAPVAAQVRRSCGATSGQSALVFRGKSDSRSITSRPFDATARTRIRFAFRYGTGSAPQCERMERGEVTLETFAAWPSPTAPPSHSEQEAEEAVRSPSWVPVWRLPRADFLTEHFSEVVAEVPTAARSPATRFRLRQDSAFPAMDAWAIDDVRVETQRVPARGGGDWEALRNSATFAQWAAGVRADTMHAACCAGCSTCLASRSSLGTACRNRSAASLLPESPDSILPPRALLLTEGFLLTLAGLEGVGLAVACLLGVLCFGRQLRQRLFSRSRLDVMQARRLHEKYSAVAGSRTTQAAVRKAQRRERLTALAMRRFGLSTQAADADWEHYAGAASATTKGITRRKEGLAAPVAQQHRPGHASSSRVRVAPEPEKSSQGVLRSGPHRVGALDFEGGIVSVHGAGSGTRVNTGRTPTSRSRRRTKGDSRPAARESLRNSAAAGVTAPQGSGWVPSKLLAAGKDQRREHDLEQQYRDKALLSQEWSTQLRQTPRGPGNDSNNGWVDSQHSASPGSSMRGNSGRRASFPGASPRSAPKGAPAAIGSSEDDAANVKPEGSPWIALARLGPELCHAPSAGRQPSAEQPVALPGAEQQLGDVPSPLATSDVSLADFSDGLVSVWATADAPPPAGGGLAEAGALRTDAIRIDDSPQASGAASAPGQPTLEPLLQSISPEQASRVVLRAKQRLAKEAHALEEQLAADRQAREDDVRALQRTERFFVPSCSTRQSCAFASIALFMLLLGGAAAVAQFAWLGRSLPAAVWIEWPTKASWMIRVELIAWAAFVVDALSILRMLGSGTGTLPCFRRTVSVSWPHPRRDEDFRKHLAECSLGIHSGPLFAKARVPLTNIRSVRYTTPADSAGYVVSLAASVVPYASAGLALSRVAGSVAAACLLVAGLRSLYGPGRFQSAVQLAGNAAAVCGASSNSTRLRFAGAVCGNRCRAAAARALCVASLPLAVLTCTGLAAVSGSGIWRASLASAGWILAVLLLGVPLFAGLSAACSLLPVDVQTVGCSIDAGLVVTLGASRGHACACFEGSLQSSTSHHSRADGAALSWLGPVLDGVSRAMLLVPRGAMHWIPLSNLSRERLLIVFGLPQRDELRRLLSPQHALDRVVRTQRKAHGLANRDASSTCSACSEVQAGAPASDGSERAAPCEGKPPSNTNRWWLCFSASPDRQAAPTQDSSEKECRDADEAHAPSFDMLGSSSAFVHVDQLEWQVRRKLAATTPGNTRAAPCGPQEQHPARLGKASVERLKHVSLGPSDETEASFAGRVYQAAMAVRTELGQSPANVPTSEVLDRVGASLLAASSPPTLSAADVPSAHTRLSQIGEWVSAQRGDAVHESSLCSEGTVAVGEARSPNGVVGEELPGQSLSRKARAIVVGYPPSRTRD